MAKITNVEVDYLDLSVGKVCNTCDFFQQPDRCSIVNFEVWSLGYCDAWKNAHHSNLTTSRRFSQIVALKPNADKEDSIYVENALSIGCGFCEYYVRENNDCKKVEGKKYGLGCCDEFEYMDDIKTALFMAKNEMNEENNDLFNIEQTNKFNKPRRLGSVED